MAITEFDFLPDTISRMKYTQYRIIASHMFKWTNLPPGLESEMLELMLIDHGTVAFFNTLEGLYILPYSSSGLIDVYGNLKNTVPVTRNGQQLTPLDTVPRILYDNSARTTFNHYLKAFAIRLAQIQKSISIMERHARIPALIKINDENRDSWARLETKIDEGYPVLFVNEAMDQTNAVQVFPTGFNAQVLDALWTDYNKVEGEIYSFLGTMYNVEQNKAAGVGPAETVMNYAQTFAFAQSRLDQRQRWCEKLNSEFGFGIQCERNTDNQMIIEEMMRGTVQEQAITPDTEKDAEVTQNDGRRTARRLSA